MCQSFGDVRYSERVIQQRGSLKIILETPMLNLNDLNMAAGNQWKHLKFTLALSKRFFSLLIL